MKKSNDFPLVQNPHGYEYGDLRVSEFGNLFVLVNVSKEGKPIIQLAENDEEIGVMGAKYFEIEPETFEKTERIDIIDW